MIANDIGTAIYLHDSAGLYYELNLVGSQVWDALGDPILLGALAMMLAVDFGTTSELVKKDIVPFVEELARRGFVTIVER